MIQHVAQDLDLKSSLYLNGAYRLAIGSIISNNLNKGLGSHWSVTLASCHHPGLHFNLRLSAQHVGVPAALPIYPLGLQSKRAAGQSR